MCKYITTIAPKLDVHAYTGAAKLQSHISKIHTDKLWYEYTYIRVDLPLILVPVLLEGTSNSKNMVQGDQDSHSFSNVLKHRLKIGVSYYEAFPIRLYTTDYYTEKYDIL